MSRSLVVLRFALGELLAGRRLPIVAALVALPLWLPSLLAPSSGQDPTSFGLDLFTNLLLKPVPRWSVLGAEYLAAVLAALLVLLPAEVVGHLLVARGLGSAVLLEGMLAATVVGVLAYSAIGLLLSLLLSRALLVGLAYALLWEGAVVGAAPSASSLSVRGYVEGVLAAILDNGGGPELATRLGPVSATTLALVVTVLALALARGRLARMDLP